MRADRFLGWVSCKGKTHGRREKHPVSAEPSALKIAEAQREEGHSLTCHSPARSQADMALEKLTTSGVRPLVLMLISRSSACSHLHEAAPTRGRSRRNRRFTLSEARQEEEQRGSGASSTGREKDERQEPCRFMRPVTSFACARQTRFSSTLCLSWILNLIELDPNTPECSHVRFRPCTVLPIVRRPTANYTRTVSVQVVFRLPPALGHGIDGAVEAEQVRRHGGAFLFHLRQQRHGLLPLGGAAARRDSAVEGVDVRGDALGPHAIERRKRLFPPEARKFSGYQDGFAVEPLQREHENVDGGTTPPCSRAVSCRNGIGCPSCNRCRACDRAIPREDTLSAYPRF